MPMPGARPGAVGDDSADPVRAAQVSRGLLHLAFAQASRIRVDEIELAAVAGGLDDLEVDPGRGTTGPGSGRCPRGRGRRRNSGPSTIPRASNWRRITRSKNSRAVRSSSHRPVRNTATSVAPASFSKATSRSGQTSGTGALSGRRSATGWGSNVTARAATPAASARSRSRPIRRDGPDERRRSCRPSHTHLGPARGSPGHSRS